MIAVAPSFRFVAPERSLPGYYAPTAQPAPDNHPTRESLWVLQEFVFGGWANCTLPLKLSEAEQKRRWLAIEAPSKKFRLSPVVLSPAPKH